MADERPEVDSRARTAVAQMVAHVLRLAETWGAWDGRPVPADDRVSTPHEAIRRMADHIIDRPSSRPTSRAPSPARPLARLVRTPADLAPFTPCSSPMHYTGLIQGDHLLRVVATDSSNQIAQVEASEYEWEVLETFDNTPPETTLERAPANGSSSTMFEFAGTDDQTPPSLITFQCRIDSTKELDWEVFENPYKLYTEANPNFFAGTAIESQLAPRKGAAAA